MTQIITKQLFDSTIGVPSRYNPVPSDVHILKFVSLGWHKLGIPTFKRLGREWRQVLSRVSHSFLLSNNVCSSARDKLTGKTVAIKKILQPFSNPFHARTTYREFKILKHLRHENVPDSTTWLIRKDCESTGRLHLNFRGRLSRHRALEYRLTFPSCRNPDWERICQVFSVSNHGMSNLCSNS